jgi:hypothetical protein
LWCVRNPMLLAAAVLFSLFVCWLVWLGTAETRDIT